MPKLSSDAQYRHFKDWHEQWKNNARINQLDTFSRETQTAALVTAIGPQVAKIIRYNLNLNIEEEGVTVNLILDRLQRHYREERNVTVDRVKFHRRRQGHNETFDEFRVALTEIAEDAELSERCEDCNHCVAHRDTQLITQMIVGIQNEEARHELLEERNFPTLDRVIEVCKAKEIADRNQQHLTGDEVNLLSKYKKEKRKN